MADDYYGKKTYTCYQCGLSHPDTKDNLCNRCREENNDLDCLHDSSVDDIDYE